MLILVLATNTAYADFPRRASILARDRYLPRQFMNQGDRLLGFFVGQVDRLCRTDLTYGMSEIDSERTLSPRNAPRFGRARRSRRLHRHERARGERCSAGACRTSPAGRTGDRRMSRWHPQRGEIIVVLNWFDEARRRSAESSSG